VGPWPGSLFKVSLDSSKEARKQAGFEGNGKQFWQFARHIATDAAGGLIQPGSKFYYFRPVEADQDTEQWVIRSVTGPCLLLGCMSTYLIADSRPKILLFLQWSLP